MNRQSLISLLGLAIGGAISVWLIPAQWDLIVVLGIVVAYVTCEISLRIQRREMPPTSPDAKPAADFSVRSIQGMAVALAILAGFVFWLMNYADAIAWAPPAVASFAFFACAALAGTAVHMLIHARKLVMTKGPDWPAAKEASG